jgi:hypothetical protein
MHRSPKLVPALLAASIWLASCAEGTGSEPGGVRGAALAGPQCPVVELGSPCPDRPWQGVVRVSTPGGEVVDEASTGQDGRFEIALEPGSYVVVAVIEPGGLTSASPANVTIETGAWTEVSLSVDTGIR